MITLVLAVGISIVVSAGCSLLESVLYSTRVITLEAAADGDKVRAHRMQHLKLKVENPLAAILILNTLANTAGAALAGWAAGEVWGPGSLWVFSLCFTLAILLFSEIIPKTVGAVHWKKLWRRSVNPLLGMCLVLKPMIVLTQAVTRLITKSREQQTPVSEDEILAAARLGATGGEISAMERDLIQNIIHLEDVRAADILTPRTVMLMVDGQSDLAQIKEQAVGWPYSRVPVFEETMDQVVGYILKSEVLAAPKANDNKPVRELAKPVSFVPATANALSLLSSFLRRRKHLYMVVDEYGGIMGLVTLEDVLESLVGSEIIDENDTVADLQEMARQRGARVLHATESPDTEIE